MGFIATRMKDDQVNRVAASLSYTSTLALVPALALALAILAAFPAFSGVRDSVQELVLSSFMPDTGMRMDEALESFIAAEGRLTTIGIAGLIVTSVLLLVTIEGAHLTGFFESQECGLFWPGWSCSGPSLPLGRSYWD